MSSFDIIIKFRVEIVFSICSPIVPLESWVISSHNPLMVVHFLGNINAFFCGIDVIICTKVWNWVVDWVSSWFFWVSVLVASSRSANWIWFRFQLNETLSIKFVLVFFFSNFKWSMGLQNIAVNSKVRDFIVHWMACWFFERSVEVTFQFFFSGGNALLGFFNIVIDSEIWNWIAWWLPCFFKWSFKFMFILFFCGFNTLESFLYIRILSKVWYEIVYWMTCWFLKRCF